MFFLAPSFMKDIAALLVKHDIVRVNFKKPFVWTSGIQSPIYCDCRELVSLTGARRMVVDGLISLIKENNLPYDMIAGTATAGIPWAAFVAEQLDAAMLYVRSKPKGHGAGKMVEGRGEQGQNILVVEDAVSTGGSSVVSAEALRSELDATVTHILGIFSWSTPLSVQNEKDHKVKFLTLTQFDEIAEALLEAGKISQAEKESLEDFNRDPAGWGDRRS